MRCQTAQDKRENVNWTINGTCDLLMDISRSTRERQKSQMTNSRHLKTLSKTCSNEFVPIRWNSNQFLSFRIGRNSKPRKNHTAKNQRKNIYRVRTWKAWRSLSRLFETKMSPVAMSVASSRLPRLVQLTCNRVEMIEFRSGATSQLYQRR